MTTETESKFQKYLETLDPKTAKELKTAATAETKRYPLASEGLTRELGGGIASGRITLIYGNRSAGKSAIIQESIGKLWQPAGLVCAYVDAEGAWDKEWAERLGVNNDELILITSKSSGKIEKEIKPHLKAGIDILVIDSISDIMAEVFVNEKGELNDLNDRKQTGAHAKTLTQLLNGIHYLNENTAVVLISQTTTSIQQTYVEQVPHGGKKVEFASTQIIKLTSSLSDNQKIKGEILRGDRMQEMAIGRKVNAIVKKNKVGPEGGSCDYDLYFRGPFVGIDRVAEILDYAEVCGVVEKSGAWYKHEGLSYQGRKGLLKAMNNDEELLAQIKKQVALVTTGEIDE
jgi:recombination protein RecA